MADGNETTVYVVQVSQTVEAVIGTDASGDSPVDVRLPREVWLDLPIVRVPARTKRATVIRTALANAGMAPEEGGRLEVRVLGPEEAEPTIVLPPETAPGPRELRL